MPSLPDELRRQARDYDEHRRQLNPDDAMSAAKFYIPTLPGLPSDSTLTMYGGHIPSAPLVNGVVDSTNDSHLYFFMIKNKHIADTSKTIFWFNGGPACSSFDGALMEVGPLRLVPGSNGQLKEVDAAWNEYANIIFVDQPAGTGYSYVSTNGYLHELPAMAQHVLQFFTNFYSVFPDLASQDTYLAGESYAGQYIPYIAHALLYPPYPLPSTLSSLALKGLLIGNGWISPLDQYPAYLDFALQSGIVKKGSETEKSVRKDVDDCVKQLLEGGRDKVKIHNGNCEGILSAITDSTVQSVNGLNMCVNNYDVRLTDTHPACGMNWPPDLSDITPYLQRAEVKTAFHANRKDGQWVECNGVVGSHFYAKDSQPSVLLLPALLEKVEILLFAGDQDLICNHVGIEALIENLEWKGAKGLANSTMQDWSVNGSPAGSWASARGLTYAKIADASHMVPYDQPLAAHDMLLRFLHIDLLRAAGPAAQVPSRVGNELEAVLGSTHLNGSALIAPPGDLGKGEVRDEEGIGGASSALGIIALLLAVLGVFWIVRRRMGGPAFLIGTSGGRGRREGGGTHELEELVEGGDYGDVEEGRGEVIFGVGSDEEEEGKGKGRR